MKIYYQPTLHSHRPQYPLSIPRPYLILAKDEWNDYSYETTFDLHYAGKEGQTLIGSLSLIIEGFSKSREGLAVVATHQFETTEFEIAARYLALPTSITFYTNLYEKLGPDDGKEVLALLHDVNYLEHLKPDTEDLELRATEAFQVSALRGGGAMESFGKGKEIIFPHDYIPSRFDFSVCGQVGRCRNEVKLDVSFNTKDAAYGLPSDVFVVIGRNGLGKTHLLYRVLSSITGSDLSQVVGGGETVIKYSDPSGRGLQRPPFKRVLAVALSPFERFPPSSDSVNEPRYIYCGCRGNNGAFEIEQAYSNIAQRLKLIIEQDIYEAQHKAKFARPKLATLIRALREGLEFKKLQLNLRHRISGSLDSIDLGNLAIDKESARILGDKLAGFDGHEILFNDLRFESLSSGQKMFLLTAVNLVAYIGNSSLVLLDEPELYLHPNLECSFMNMFRSILRAFESRAIVATHSVYVARETGSDNVAILRETDGDLVITKPAFQTFGADIGMLANYIFENLSQPKHYEQWLRSLVRSGLTAEAVVERYGVLINLESVAILRDEQKKQGMAF